MHDDTTTPQGANRNVDAPDFGATPTHHAQQAAKHYELVALALAVILCAFLSILPSLIYKLSALPYGLVSLSLVIGAIIASDHRHVIRFWVFVTASVLVSLGGIL